VQPPPKNTTALSGQLFNAVISSAKLQPAQSFCPFEFFEEAATATYLHQLSFETETRIRINKIVNSFFIWYTCLVDLNYPSR